MIIAFKTYLFLSMDALSEAKFKHSEMRTNALELDRSPYLWASELD